MAFTACFLFNCFNSLLRLRLTAAAATAATHTPAMIDCVLKMHALSERMVISRIGRAGVRRVVSLPQCDYVNGSAQVLLPPDAG